MPRANRLMLVGVLLLVFLFKSSDALANAYGIAVTGTMVVDDVARLLRRLEAVALAAAGPSLPVIGFFLVIDLAFLFANLVKVLDGGWVPLLLAGCSMLADVDLGARHAPAVAEDAPRFDPDRAISSACWQKSKPTRVPGTAIFLTSDPEVAPSSLMHNLKHNKVLHERIIIMSVRTRGHAARAARQALRDREALGRLHRDHAALRLHGDARACPPRSPACARRAEVRHHDDVVLPRPAHPEDVGQLRHAAVAGQAVHRAVEAGRDRDGLLLHPVRPRGRARRAGRGVNQPPPLRPGSPFREACAAARPTRLCLMRRGCSHHRHALFASWRASARCHISTRIRIGPAPICLPRWCACVGPWPRPTACS